MTDDEVKLKEALDCYSQGNVEDCIKLSEDVYQNTGDKFQKLQAINFLTCSLKKPNCNKRLIELCDEGMQLSLDLKRHDILATYMAFKAECLTYRCSVLFYKIRNLKMSPGWKSFALESEKKLHDNFVAKRDKHKKEADGLISKAVEIAENIGDKMILARVLRSKALICGENRLVLQMERIRESKAYLFFLNNFNLKFDFLLVNKKGIKKITNEQRDILLRAADLVKQCDNNQELAYILFSLVSEMLVAGRTGEARKYLAEAKVLAHTLGEKILINQAELLEDSIQNKKSDEELEKPPKFGDY